MRAALPQAGSAPPPEPPAGGRLGTAAALFAQPYSLRWTTERRALVLTLLFAPLTIALIGFILPEHVTIQQVAALIVVAMVYVTIVRGRLLGTSIRAHEQQLPELHAVVERCARMLGLPMPHVFVREDLYVCITSMGLGQPYALALSSQWLPHLEEDELMFLVGAELGHIAAGHTRLSSLFSASGKENPFIALVIGAWLRRTEYTADRVGLLCCGSMDAAIRAIFKCSFHPVASKVSYLAFADQRRELEVDPALRMGEWLGEAPYAVNRLRELQRFTDSPLYAHWRAEFDRRLERIDQETAAPEPPTVVRNAGFFQRSIAFFIDYIVVSLIVSGVYGVEQQVQPTLGKGAQLPQHATSWVTGLNSWLIAHNVTVSISGLQFDTLFFIFAYSAVLVAFTGRTFGMMVLGLRVVRDDLSRVGGVRAILRYLAAYITTITIFPLLFGLFTGRFMHDRITGTRVVRGGA
jgi:Zn-dependent protease with chaperone function